MLSLRPGTPGFTETMNRLDQGAARDTAITLLSGPEGGLSPAEEDTAMTCGFAPSTLSRRVLRAETAALCGLAALVVL